MFDILKKKLNSIIETVTKRITKKVEREKEKEVREVKEKKVEEKKPIVKAIAERIVKKVVERKITEEDLTGILDEIEIDLLEADVAVEVIEKLKEDIRKNLVGKDANRTKVKEVIQKTIKDSLLEVLSVPQISVEELVKKSKKDNKSCLLVFLGFNGSGKTSSISKIGYLLKNKGYSCVFAAADTFRAGSEEQLEELAEKLKIKVIKHQYGADPAAVVFDAMSHAKSRDIDFVLADTAGRMHTNKNLMDQLNKICTVNKPQLKILVIDSLTGNDAVTQAEMFDKAVGVDAIIFTKVDVNKKGGAILSVSKILNKPIICLTVGQKYQDLIQFTPNQIIENLLG